MKTLCSRIWTVTLLVSLSLARGGGEEDDGAFLHESLCIGNDVESVPFFDGNETLRFQRPGRPDRTYRLYTPFQYNHNESSKLVLSFHGWCEDGTSWTLDATIQSLADQYNYIIVAPDGLGDNEGSCNSWSFPGSTTGLGPDGTTPTCNTEMEETDNCYQSCRTDRVCGNNRCSWTHCQDDDVQFVLDLVRGGHNCTGALVDTVCFDPNRIFVMGSSNGGMMTWSLLQDPKTAPLFVAAAPMIGLPHCGYNRSGTVPVISLTSQDDETVSPSTLPYPGHPADICVENRDGEGYRYVSSHTMTSIFAQAGGCPVGDAHSSFPPLDYDYDTGLVFQKQQEEEAPTLLECKTWCPGKRNPPFAVDCSFRAGHWTPDYVYRAAFGFFERHGEDLR